MPVAVPYPHRPPWIGGNAGGAYAGLAYVEVSADIDELYLSGAFNMRDIFRAALNAGLLEHSQVAKDFARAYEQTTRGSRNQLANLHHQVGSLMAADVQEAYREAKASRGRNLPPYRPPFLSRESERDAGGRMEAALESEDFFRGTYDGIGFANRTMLDRHARQWHRLNFGAGGAAGSRARQFPLRWQGAVLASVGYTDGPSRPFLMPRGLFREGAFYPRGARPVYRTRGIQAWHFLDAGVETMTREIGPAYDGLHARWMASAQRGVGPLSRVVTVAGRAGAPPR